MEISWQQRKCNNKVLRHNFLFGAHIMDPDIRVLYQLESNVLLNVNANASIVSSDSHLVR